MNELYEEYKHAVSICKNKKIGGGCYEFCPYRENGCCEISVSEVINQCLKDLLNINPYPNPGVDFYSNLANQLIELVECNNKKKALISGSFDPFTNGHLQMVKQASDIFDEVHVVIFKNSNKKRMFDASEMIRVMGKTFEEKELYNVVVAVSDGMVADYCVENGIKYSVRGLRNSFDYAYEEDLVYANNLIHKTLQTVYLRGNETQISSTMVREFLTYNKDVSGLVPKRIFELIKQLNCLATE